MRMSIAGKLSFGAVVFCFVYVLGFLKPFGAVGAIVTALIGAVVVVKMLHWLKGST